ncbi:MAG: hypothetical protein ACOYJB_10625 [Christensenellaceae bacterium]
MIRGRRFAHGIDFAFHRLYSLIKKLFDKAKRLYYNVLQSYDEEK